jgi:putative transposase
LARNSKNKKKDKSKAQTLKATAKIINLTDEIALILGLLAFFATKLWNVANHHRQSLWEATGKIPNFYDQCKELKTNRWYKLLPSQTAQEILGELDDAYRAWFSHRKNGNSEANPPGFRKKDSLSSLTFKQNAFRILPENRVELHLPKTLATQRIILEFILPPKTMFGKIQEVELVYAPKTGDWTLYLTHVVAIKYRDNGNTMALDLGIINIIAGFISNGFTFLVPGSVLLAIDHYFHKEKSKCTSTKSTQCRRLNQKWSRQRRHYLHVLTKWLVELALSQNVSVIVVGDLKGIRTDKDWGAKGNQKLHAWPYNLLVEMLTYKAQLAGIRVVKVSERNSSTTCPVCGERAKEARKTRGQFIHCRQTFNADVVGAYNILKTYLQQAGSPASGVLGALARPAINLFVWGKATPLGREQGTFKQAS